MRLLRIEAPCLEEGGFSWVGLFQAVVGSHERAFVRWANSKENRDEIRGAKMLLKLQFNQNQDRFKTPSRDGLDYIRGYPYEDFLENNPSWRFGFRKEYAPQWTRGLEYLLAKLGAVLVEYEVADECIVRGGRQVVFDGAQAELLSRTPFEA